jgi:F-type H+-transporting ATPase subunit alpha
MNTNHKDVMDQLAAGKYSDELTDVLEKVALELADKY